jgi:hypothetical protein
MKLNAKTKAMVLGKMFIFYQRMQTAEVSSTHMLKDKIVEKSCIFYEFSRLFTQWTLSKLLIQLCNIH